MPMHMQVLRIAQDDKFGAGPKIANTEVSPMRFASVEMTLLGIGGS